MDTLWEYVTMVITIAYFLFFLAVYLLWRLARERGWPLRFWIGEFWFIALIVWMADGVCCDYSFSKTFLTGEAGGSGVLILLAWIIGVVVRFFRS